MKITGKNSISSIIKVFLIILFIVCILVMLGLPVLMKNIGYNIFEDELKIEIIFMYIAAIPALLMIIEFEKIFSSFSNDDVFNRKNEKRLSRTSIYSLAIGIIFLLNSITYFNNGNKLSENYFWVMYLIVIILISMIFLILSIGLMILKNVYKVSVDNKEENDLTI